MKNRTIPFGYMCENGSITVHPKEEDVLKGIFSAYLAGESMQCIANRLNVRQVEYMPGVIVWNKARIMRIIQDTRYLGGTGYPALIDEETYKEAQECKARKNNQKDIDRHSDIFQLSVPVICPQCGSQMVRRHDSRRNSPQKWSCKDTDCRTLIAVEDVKLFAQITDLLNYVIENSQILQDEDNPIHDQPAEVYKLEWEIIEALNSNTIEAENIRRKMMECVSLKYKNLPSERNTAGRLRVDFEASEPLAVFSVDLANRTISAIRLKKDSTVEIELRNHQIIGRG